MNTLKRKPLFPGMDKTIEKLKACIEELEAENKDLRIKKTLDKACADEQFDTIQELKARIQELEDQVLALNQVIQKQSTRIRAFGYGWQEGDKTRVQELEAENKKLREAVMWWKQCDDLYRWGTQELMMGLIVNDRIRISSLVVDVAVLLINAGEDLKQALEDS